jgi:hypothetical protein
LSGACSRARRGRERRYQDSIRSVGELMRLFGATIAALERRSIMAAIRWN